VQGSFQSGHPPYVKNNKEASEPKDNYLKNPTESVEKLSANKVTVNKKVFFFEVVFFFNSSSFEAFLHFGLITLA
jgi:hypothetical protein